MIDSSERREWKEGQEDISFHFSIEWVDNLGEIKRKTKRRVKSFIDKRNLRELPVGVSFWSYKI